MSDPHDKQVDKATETNEQVDDLSRQEIDAGRVELAKKEKERDQFLKRGGASGISGKFGSASDIFSPQELAQFASQVSEKSTASAKDGAALAEAQKHAPAPAAALKDIGTEAQVAKLLVGVAGLGSLNEVKTALGGKTEEQIKDLDAAFRKKADQSLEEFFKKHLDGANLARALELLHHKDAPVKLPEGVDREKIRAANEEIFKAEKKERGFPATSTFVEVDTYVSALKGKTPDELKAMSVLFKESYGETLEEHVKKYMFNERTSFDDLLAIARELAQDPAALAAVMAPIIIWDDDREGEMIDDQVAELHRRDAGTFWLLAQALLAHADQGIVDLASRAIERAEHAEREEPVDVTIMAELAEILDEVAGVSTDQVRAESTFVDDLDIDSLSMVEIAVAAQDKFGVEVPDDDLKTFLTVGDVVNYIKKALAEQGRRLRR